MFLKNKKLRKWRNKNWNGGAFTQERSTIWKMKQEEERWIMPRALVVQDNHANRVFGASWPTIQEVFVLLLRLSVPEIRSASTYTSPPFIYIHRVETRPG